MNWNESRHVRRRGAANGRGALSLACLMGVIVAAASPSAAREPNDKSPVAAAVLQFQDRTELKGTAAKVTELLAAELASAPELMLVEREELDKILKEFELTVSGAVPAAETIQIGRLTGARILITGSVIDLENDRYLVAKIISTETSRVLGASAKGKAADGLAELVQKVATEITRVIREKGATVLPADLTRDDRLNQLKKRLEGETRPAVLVRITESHVGAPRIDPAAQTEVTLWCQSLGFRTIDPVQGNESDADFVITGEGLSELSSRRGNLVSVQARLELKVVNRRTGDVVGADRQTIRRMDATEQVAGKQALQEAAADLAERLLPTLINQIPQPVRKPRRDRLGS